MIRYFINIIFCIATVSMQAQSMQDSIKVPNVFTPNLDGVNDVFKADLSFEKNPQAYKLEIYNRFGINVFESSKMNQYWDGRTTSGMPCAEGTYFYILQLTINSEKLEYKGFLQLFR